jgi:hypothetical protein
MNRQLNQSVNPEMAKYTDALQGRIAPFQGMVINRRLLHRVWPWTVVSRPFVPAAFSRQFFERCVAAGRVADMKHHYGLLADEKDRPIAALAAVEKLANFNGEFSAFRRNRATLGIRREAVESLQKSVVPKCGSRRSALGVPAIRLLQVAGGSIRKNDLVGHA